MRIAFPILVGLSLCHAGFGQTDPEVAFEVATVRPSAPGGRGGGMVGGPGSSDPERLSFTNLSLLLAVSSAYGVRGDQLVAPAWLGSAQFDIFAKIPAGATHEQFQQMFQNLLAERFHLQVHHETREFPAYNLVIAKPAQGRLGPPNVQELPCVPPSQAPLCGSVREKGPKLKPSSADRIAAHASTVAPPGMMAAPDQLRLVGTSSGGRWKIRGEAATVSGLASMLRTHVGGRVVDQTSLTGVYDFTLEFSRSLDAQSDEAPYIFDAVREQLGLELMETKVSLDVVVVDRMDKTPTEN